MSRAGLRAKEKRGTINRKRRGQAFLPPIFKQKTRRSRKRRLISCRAIRTIGELSLIHIFSDPFWSKVQTLVREVVIPFQKQVLEDAVPGVEKSHAVENFRIAAGEQTGDFYGFVFQDSDVAKWLEAVAYSLALHPDEKLEKEALDLIALVGRAQEPDGYLDTYFTVKEPDHKWQDLQECHELYCAGHMLEAAVAWAEAAGRTELLDIMKKNADLICSLFGKDKRRGYPGHEEIEMALIRLYRLTGEKKYLETAGYFLEERGTEPVSYTHLPSGSHRSDRRCRWRPAP